MKAILQLNAGAKLVSELQFYIYNQELPHHNKLIKVCEVTHGELASKQPDADERTITPLWKTFTGGVE